MAVVESMVVGVIVIAGVTAVATMKDPTSPSGGARSALTDAAMDVLAILDELPAENPAYYSSLEEIITLAVQGNRAPLKEKLDEYFPPGVRYEMFLDNGRGGIYPVYSLNETPGTESITSAHILSPHWTHLYMMPLVEQVSGTVPLDALGIPTPPISNTLTINAVLVRNSYVDKTTQVQLTTANNFPMNLSTGTSVRTTGAVAPEYRKFALPGNPSYQPGFEVPYTTTATWVEYKTDSLLVTQDVAKQVVRHNHSFAQTTTPLFNVHPTYTLSSTISAVLNALPTGSRWQASATDYNLSDDATFTWNYNALIGTIIADNRTVRIHSPAGGVEQNDFKTSDVLAGSYTWEIPYNSLWGTYVAEIEISAHDPLDAAKIYLFRELATFNVNPPGGFTTGQHIPPIYRVVLNAWQGEWAGDWSPLDNGSGGEGPSLLATPSRVE